MISQRKSRVLVVEDEPFIRIDTRMSLKEAGFDVFEALDGDDAIEVLLQNPDIDAVFTDVDMPGDVDGAALAGMLSETCPGMVLIITSGAVTLQAADLPPGALFVAKPYDIDTVAKLFHLMLSGGACRLQ